MKYKVGDKVRIVSKRTFGMYPEEELDDYLGTIMTITRVNNSGSYKMFEDGGYWTWTDAMIEGYAYGFEPLKVDESGHIERNCENCSFCSRSCDEFPCDNCARNYLSPNNYPDLWAHINRVPMDERTAIHHPKHYNRENSIECIDEMVAVFGVDLTKYFCLMNVWKYRYRACDKNGVEDLQKSDWYMKKYLELSGGNE